MGYPIRDAFLSPFEYFGDSLRWHGLCKAGSSRVDDRHTQLDFGAGYLVRLLPLRLSHCNRLPFARRTLSHPSSQHGLPLLYGDPEGWSGARVDDDIVAPRPLKLP